jgi:hypothetical protein
VPVKLTAGEAGETQFSASWEPRELSQEAFAVSNEQRALSLPVPCLSLDLNKT